MSLLILSYVLTDYVMLSDRFEHNKEANAMSILKQSMIFLVCGIAITIYFLSLYMLLVITILYIAYIINMYLKQIINYEEKHMHKFIWCILEHLAMVIVILSLYPLLIHIKPNRFMSMIFNKLMSVYPFLKVLNHINLLAFIALVIAGLLFSIRSGTRLSLIIINLPADFKASNKKAHTSQSHLLSQQQVAATMMEADISEFNEAERMKRYGRIIGITERLIIIYAILISQFQIVLLLITIKSIGRFKEITNKTSDYYIIGNFASFSIAFLIGFALVAARSLLLD